MKETKNFIVLALVEDFEFNGISLMAKKAIASYRDGEFEECVNKVIRFNRSIERIQLPSWLNQCNTFEDVFKETTSHNIWPLVEILFNKNKESALYMGPILKVEKKEFEIFCYDAAGKWEKEYILNYREIFRIGYFDKYSTNFNNFMKQRDGKDSQAPYS